jgi:hypothetical protein
LELFAGVNEVGFRFHFATLDETQMLQVGTVGRLLFVRFCELRRSEWCSSPPTRKVLAANSQNNIHGHALSHTPKPSNRRREIVQHGWRAKVEGAREKGKKFFAKA